MKQRRSAKNQNKLDKKTSQKLFTVIVIMIGIGIFILLRMGRIRYQNDSNSPLSVGKGDHVYVNNELGKAYIATNKNTWDAFVDTYESKDPMGRIALIMNESVFASRNGTKCLVLEPGWELMKVRVLEGPETGKSGYTLKKLFSKSP